MYTGTQKKKGHGDLSFSSTGIHFHSLHTPLAKVYAIKLKLEECEHAEMSSNEIVRNYIHYMQKSLI